VRRFRRSSSASLLSPRPATTSVSNNTLTAWFALHGDTAHVEAVCETVDSHGLRDVQRGGCAP